MSSPSESRPASESPQPRPGFERVLVTGGSGFVGSCAVRRLLGTGYTVHLLVRDRARLWRLEGVLRHPRVAIGHADLVDLHSVRRAVADARADVVVHLATEGAYEHQSDARRILTMNILGTHNLLEASTEAGVRLFVNAGSSSEYGYKDHPMREDEVLHPNSSYAVSKAAQTHLVALASRTRDFAAATFRLFSVYGPWEEATRLIPTLIRRARVGQPLVMTAPETARDFVYVEDVLDVLLGFDRLTHLRGEVFNVGTGVQSTLREVVAVIQREIGSLSEVRWGDMPPRRWDTASWCADPTASLDALGWRAKVDLTAGVRKMARWMMEVGDDYGPQAVRA